jgi:hypothetical protein
LSIGPPPRCLVLTKSSRHRRPALSDCCSYTRIIESTFHRIGATQESACTQNHGAEFIRIGPPPSCCSYSQSYQYNCFFEYPTSQGVLVPKKSCIRYTGGWARLQIVALTQEQSTTFFIVSGPPRSACTHKIRAEFYLIGPPPVVARNCQSYQYNCFEYRPTSKVRCSYSQKIMHPTPAADGPPFRLLFTQE